MAPGEGSDIGETPLPGERATMDGFVWTPRAIPSLRGPAGDMWCVRDAFSELMAWRPGSPEWLRFIEAPVPGDMDRLCDHLGLVWCDPDRQPEIFGTYLDHPGIAVYAFHGERLSHVMYQPHLRHLRPLPPQYAPFRAELFRIIADLRQAPGACLRCHVGV